jgi:AAA family ATP:ADP antiporter
VRRALRELIADDSRRVNREALHAAGRLRDPELVGLLLEKLRVPDHRAAATDALVLYAESVIPRLLDELEGVDAVPLQLSIVRVLSRMEIQAAVDGLVGVLPSASRALHHAVLRALKRLRSRAHDLRFPEAALRRQLSEEVAYQLGLRRAISAQPDSREPADRLLFRALMEKRKESLDAIFGLLALIYPYEDMQNAFAAVSSDHHRARANAIEFLDNVLTRHDKERVLPLLENEVRVGAGRSSRRGLDELARGRDAWLRACAVFSAGRDPAFSDLVTGALNDPDPVVREAARACVNHSEAAC